MQTDQTLKGEKKAFSRHPTNMSQENTSFPLNVACADGPTTTVLTTDNTTWLNKFCTELGYHNLAFLARYRPPNAGAQGDGSLAGTTSAGTLDTVDGCIGVTGHKIIKAVVAIILEHLIDGELRRFCYGCEHDHPSQIQHSCLYEAPAYFFLGCFEELSQKLFKPDLKSILARTLKLFGLTPHLQRIQGVVDCVLCELRDEMYIVEGLAELRKKLVDETCEQAIYDAVDSWKKSASADSD
ncbi:hypothetical protein M9458_051813 [Cirrhinus mrigala]|uniref:Uncharacterized protein n=1 Tax=Cirrhinus mrigala TaxID=683832 RepID=A0ABD0MV53_CIRMR